MRPTCRPKIKRVLLVSTMAAALLTLPLLLVPANNPVGFVQPAAAQARIEISFFFDALAPYGAWVDHPRYGYVFIPDVDRGWRPYTVGHWVYTKRYGWYWQSDEPFAWAVYHYGRWDYDPDYGWFWVPGTEWAPAWVSWRQGGGHVGWAPCAPRDPSYVIGRVDYYEPPIVEAWVFVPERRFLVVNVINYVVPVVEINVVLRKTKQRYHVRRHDDDVVNDFLPRQRIRRFIKHEINVYNLTEVEDRDRARRNRAEHRYRRDRTLAVYRPRIAEKEPEKLPDKIAKSPDELKRKPTLRHTARGDRPKNGPPSAAELKPTATSQGDRGRLRRERQTRAEGETRTERRERQIDERGKARTERREDRTKRRKTRTEALGERAKRSEDKVEVRREPRKEKGETQRKQRRDKREARRERHKDRVEVQRKGRRDESKARRNRHKDKSEARREPRREKGEAQRKQRRDKGKVRRARHKDRGEAQRKERNNKDDAQRERR